MHHPHPIPTSSWIRSLDYLPYTRESKSKGAVPPGTHGFLILTSVTGTKYAWAVPSYLYGLLLSASVRGLSVGRLFNRWVRGKYPSINMQEIN
jgi:hypothetical protein